MLGGRLVTIQTGAEGTTVNTKYGMVRTDHILFIAAGAFHVSKPSDLIPELQGRFPIRVELQPLTEAGSGSVQEPGTMGVTPGSGVIM